LVLGVRQSPINIDTSHVRRDIDKSVTVYPSNITNPSVVYAEGELKVSNTGSYATLHQDEEDRNYTLSNFHFHAPSEHAVNGKFYDLEMHNVFSRVEGNMTYYMVVGILFELTSKQDNYTLLSNLQIDSLTLESYSTYARTTTLDYHGFLSEVNGKAKYNYPGSLTTANCSENVEWFVTKDPMKINGDQLYYFTRLWQQNSNFASGSGNNRALQPLKSRQIYLTHGDDDETFVITTIILICLIALSLGAIIGLCIYIIADSQNEGGEGKQHHSSRKESKEHSYVPEDEELEGHHRDNHHKKKKKDKDDLYEESKHEESLE